MRGEAPEVTARKRRPAVDWVAFYSGDPSDGCKIMGYQAVIGGWLRLQVHYHGREPRGYWYAVVGSLVLHGDDRKTLRFPKPEHAQRAALEKAVDLCRAFVDGHAPAAGTAEAGALFV